MAQTDSLHESIHATCSLIHRDSHILAFVGSGLSAESGVPTFRGPDGYYLDSRIERLTHVNTFDVDPQTQLQWYQQRRDQIRKLDPNSGHDALAQISTLVRCSIATQNVDFLLERACERVGASPDIWHLHGSLLEVKCHDCTYRVNDMKLDLALCPKCPKCQGRLRPGVVWFGEQLPADALESSMDAARQADICFLLGTSALVYPAAMLPELAKQHGAKLIEINPQATALSNICDVVIRAKTGEVLPRIYNYLRAID